MTAGPPAAIVRLSVSAATGAARAGPGSAPTDSQERPMFVRLLGCPGSTAPLVSGPDMPGEVRP
jgi:hypothetical protein